MSESSVCSESLFLQESGHGLHLFSALTGSHETTSGLWLFLNISGNNDASAADTNGSATTRL